MGKGRTTVGMVAGCLIKEVQVTSELKRMQGEGLIAEDIFQVGATNLSNKDDLTTSS